MKRLTLIFLSLCLVLSVCRVYGQQAGISVSGKITGSEDQLPIRVVSVSIERKGVGTATNAAGAFALIIPAANLNDTLKISHIGFKTQRLPIKNLKNGQELSIALEKINKELSEVSIEYDDPQKIIQKAISRIPDNYINQPHIIRGFYRMYTYNDDEPLELSEAVFDVYNFGYADKRADLFRLIKARNERNERDLSILELGQKPNSVFEYDIVNHLFASGLLNDAGLAKHKFEVTGKVDVKGYQAYRVEFEEKAGTEGGSFRGTMYIDTKTYAFIYFDFGLSPTGLKDMSTGVFAKRALSKLGDIDLHLTDDHTKVSYQEVGNKWVLADVEGDDVLKIRDHGTSSDLVAHVKFNYQVTSVDTDPPSAFSTKMGRNDSINDQENDGSERFWKDYNILLSDFNTEDVFKQIKDINKAMKFKEK